MAASASGSMGSHRRHASVPRHACPDCGRTYNAVETLNRHRKNHSETAQYQCILCDATFKRKDLLDRHKQIHSVTTSCGKRRRGQRACTRCSRLKTRCDNLEPCSRCAAGDHVCVYMAGSSRSRQHSSQSRSPDSRNDSLVDEASQDLDVFSACSPTEAASKPLAATLAPSEGESATWDFCITQGVDCHNDWNEAVQLDHSQDCWPSPIANNDVGLAGATIAAEMTDESQTGVLVNGVSGVSFDAEELWLQCSFGSQDQPVAPAGLERSSILPSPVETTPDEECIGHPERPSAESLCDLSYLDTIGPVHMPQQRLVAELAIYASSCAKFFSHRSGHCAFWRATSCKIELAFGLEYVHAGEQLLQHFVSLFFEHFDIHWSIMCKQDATLRSVPPHLYLAMASIGAAYAGAEGGEFYALMSDALRAELLLATFQQPLTEDTLYTLCQALAMLQAAMLLFGDRKAFRHAQDVGSALTALAHRLNLFDESASRTIDHFLEASPDVLPGNAARSWKYAESRRRLAVGILRLESFLSLLIDTRPHVSYEDVDVQFPVPVAIWLSDNMQEQLSYQSCYQANNERGLSTVVRAALETDANFTGSRPDEMEHVLYGLQLRVWRCSQELISAQRCYLDVDKEDSEGLRRLMSVLGRWKQAMTTAVKSTEDRAQRRVIMNCMLLYSMTIMKLRSDLAAFHRLALGCTRDEPISADQLHATRAWAGTESARVTVQHALSIRTVIAEEMGRPKPSRADFTIIAQIALLHAAIVIWVYSGTAEATLGVPGTSLEGSDGAVLMHGFDELLVEIQPLTSKASIGLRSYHTTASALAMRPLSLYSVSG